MICKKCKKEIPDDSLFCLYCGRKQKDDPRKELRRANGTGSVVKASGRRRKIWMVRVSKTTNGVLERKTIGYYEKKSEALAVLDKYLTKGLPELNGILLKDIYELWKNEHFEKLTKSSKDNYMAAWKYFEPIKSRPIQELTKIHYQSIIDNAKENKSRSTCEKIKQLCSQLCKYAIENDLIDKNYAEFLTLPNQKESTRDKYTDDEIYTVWKHTDDDKTAKIILVLLFTGLRIDELFSMPKENVYLYGPHKYMIGGKKTKAGKNRIIPLHPYIVPIMCEWMDSPGKYLLCNSNGGKYNPSNFRNRMYYPFLEAHNIRKLPPHCTRHTFASICVKYGINAHVLKAVMGHSKYETVADIYTHVDMQQMFDEITKISI